MSEPARDASDAKPMSFGVECIVGAVQGAIAGIPCGIVLLLMSEPSRPRSPGALDIAFGSFFGATAGAVIGATEFATDPLPKQSRWHAVRLLVAPVFAVILGGLVCVAIDQTMSGLDLPERFRAFAQGGAWRRFGSVDFFVELGFFNVFAVMPAALMALEGERSRWRRAIAAVPAIAITIVFEHVLDARSPTVWITALSVAVPLAHVPLIGLALGDPLARRLRKRLEPDD